MITQRLRHIEVILKTVERCNINCSYCYFFNGLGQSYLKHPAYISKSVIEKTATFLKQAAEEYQPQQIRIDLHGGEPLMQKPQEFDEMCEIFYRTISPICDLYLAIQTNATLINEKWLALFEKYAISAGVSLDGTKEYNDIYRLDKRGRSTYDKTLLGLQQLLASASQKKFLNQAYYVLLTLNMTLKKFIIILCMN